MFCEKGVERPLTTINSISHSEFWLSAIFVLHMAMILERVAPHPAMSLREMKDFARNLYGDRLLDREGTFDCLECFGQSRSFRDGFERMNLRCQSFDFRTSLCKS